MATGNLGEVVPVIRAAIGGDVTVDEIKIESSVVVQISKLSAKTPAADFDIHCARKIIVLKRLARGPLAWHPEVVSLDQNAFFGNVRNVDRIFTLVEDVSDGSIHAALWRGANAGLLTHFVKLLA